MSHHPRKIPSTVFHLQMRSLAELRATAEPAGGFDLRRIEPPDPALNRQFYATVGAPWNWVDRLSWSTAQWLEYLDRPEQETWVLYRNGAPAGYFELEQQPEHNVELVYFGLLPDFIGQGLGGHLLTRAVQRAWALDARRVWVHTCSEDHPAALNNYKAKGFRQFEQETVWIEAPSTL